jgi:hypothetical protein
MSELTTIHHLYIQALLSRRCTRETTAIKVFKRCCEILQGTLHAYLGKRVHRADTPDPQRSTRSINSKTSSTRLAKLSPPSASITSVVSISTLGKHGMRSSTPHRTSWLSRRPSTHQETSATFAYWFVPTLPAQHPYTARRLNTCHRLTRSCALPQCASPSPSQQL